jgi:hypothetical protein
MVLYEREVIHQITAKKLHVTEEKREQNLGLCVPCPFRRRGS